MTTDLPPAAQRILDSLPGDLPRPHVDDYPIDNWMSPENPPRRYMLCWRPNVAGHAWVEILPHAGKVAYAFGRDYTWRCSGTEPLTDRLPDSLVVLLRRVLHLPEPTIQELQDAYAVAQSRLTRAVCGDPSKGVAMRTVDHLDEMRSALG